MGKDSLHILLADDHPLILDSLQKVINERFGCTKISCAKTGQEAIDILENEKIDFVITDWDMPEIGGFEIAKLAVSKNIKTVILTSHTDIVYLRQMQSIKANGILLKTMDDKEILEKIISVWEGKNYIHPEAKIILENAEISTMSISKLSEKETAILQMMCGGLTAKEISNNLNISVKTIEKYKTAVFRKLGVSNTLQAVVKAQKLKLI